MSGETDPSRLLDRLVGAAVSVLLASMALYGAVQIVTSVWVQLCIGIAVVLALAGAWLVVRRAQGW